MKNTFFKYFLLTLGFFMFLGVHANVDISPIYRTCHEYRPFTENVTNGTCSGTERGTGTELVRREQSTRTGQIHNHPSGVCSGVGGWTVVSRTCTPTYQCQDNSAVDLTNASPVSPDELPYPNSPNYPPIFPLDRHYPRTLVFSNNTSVSATAASCEYTCNNGYRAVDQGTTSATITTPATTTTTTTTVTRSTNPTAAPTWEAMTGVQSCQSVCKNVGKFYTGRCTNFGTLTQSNPGNIFVWGGLKKSSGIFQPYVVQGDPSLMYCFSTPDHLSVSDWNMDAGFSATTKLDKCECSGTTSTWVHNADFSTDVFRESQFQSSYFYKRTPDVYSESIVNNSMLFEAFDNFHTAQKVCEYYGMEFKTGRTDNYAYYNNIGTRYRRDSSGEDAHILWLNGTTVTWEDSTTVGLASIKGIIVPDARVANWHTISDGPGLGVMSIKCDPPSSPTGGTPTCTLSGCEMTAACPTTLPSGCVTDNSCSFVGSSCSTLPAGCSASLSAPQPATLCVNPSSSRDYTLSCDTGDTIIPHNSALPPPTVSTDYHHWFSAQESDDIACQITNLATIVADNQIRVRCTNAQTNMQGVYNFIYKCSHTETTTTPPTTATQTADRRMCTPIVCTGLLPTDAVFCADDTTTLSGHEDITYVRRDTATACTPQQKCEWHCPAARPYYCAVTNACVVSQAQCAGSLEVTKIAPVPPGTTNTITTVNGDQTCTGVTPGTVSGTYRATFEIEVRNTGTLPLQDISVYDSRSRTSAPGAIATANSAGTTATIVTGGSDYLAAPSVTVSGGTCTTRPTATATINAAGSVTGVTLTGALNCTVAPVLTIAPPQASGNPWFAVAKPSPFPGDWPTTNITYPDPGYHPCNGRFLFSPGSLNRPTGEFATFTLGTTTDLSDGKLDPGESFKYRCIEDNIPMSDFVSGLIMNRVHVQGRVSGTNVAGTPTAFTTDAGDVQICLNKCSKGTIATPPTPPVTSTTSGLCPTGDTVFGFSTVTNTAGTQVTATWGCNNATRGNTLIGTEGGGTCSVTYPTTSCTGSVNYGTTPRPVGLSPVVTPPVCTSGTLTYSVTGTNCTIDASTGALTMPQNAMACQVTATCANGANSIVCGGSAVTINTIGGCTGSIPLGNALCPGSGQAPQPYTRLPGCTPPSGQTVVPSCSYDISDCSAITVPSQINVGDQPIIQCSPISGVTATHFKYTLTAGTNTFTSGIHPLGTSVVHTEPLAAGTYTVRCFYGNATSATEANQCSENIVVHPVTNVVQGCSRIYGYRDNTLSDVMRQETPFNAHFRCGSRLPVTSTFLNPYRLQIAYAVNPFSGFLGFEGAMSELLNGIGIGPVSVQSGPHSFAYNGTSSVTDVLCSVRVTDTPGDGYSTHDQCKIRTCVGAECATPRSFVITPSSNDLCTTAIDASYDLRCNPDSYDYQSCMSWIAGGTPPSSVTVRINGADTSVPLTCSTTTPPGALNPVRTCRLTLVSGEDVTVFTGDYGTEGSLQATVYTLARDTGIPTGTLRYFTTRTAGVEVQNTLWQNQAVNAVITCNDIPGVSDGSDCACAQTLDGDTNNLWYALPSSDPSIGPDIMTYTRRLENTTGSLTGLRVRDTAGNLGTALTPDIGVDTLSPSVTISGTTTVTLSVTDMGSKLWKPGSGLSPVPASITSSGSILYRKGPRTNQAALEFDQNCSIAPDNGNYYRYSETAALPASQSSQSVTISGVAATDIVTYCIQDNAGNVTRGVYPSTYMGCFSSTDMTQIPVFHPTTSPAYYGPLLSNRLAGTPQLLGFSFSEDQDRASCFRGMLALNINTLVATQYDPDTPAIISDWDTARASMLGSSTVKNTQGYYYRNSSLALTSNPSGTGNKVVIADGGDIHINNDIEYLAPNKTLVLIARRNVAGTGGNISINPNVRRIDAILIADGGVLLNRDAVTGTPRTWINTSDRPLLDTRLVINGRIYSYNTRGGSLTISGTDLVPATGPTGKIFDHAGVLIPNASADIAGQQDLERFRVLLPDGNNQCTLHVNYRVISGSSLPLVLQRPAGYVTTSICSF